MLIHEFYSNMHGIDSSVPLFHTCVRGTRIVVTPELVSDVLRVLRVEHLDYLGYECLRTASKDEMIFSFCEHLLSHTLLKSLVLDFAFFVKAPHYRFSYTFHSFYYRCV